LGSSIFFDAHGNRTKTHKRHDHDHSWSDGLLEDRPTSAKRLGSLSPMPECRGALMRVLGAVSSLMSNNHPER